MSSEWIATTIGEYIEKYGGEIKTGPFGTTLKASEYSNCGVPIVAVREISYGKLIISDETPKADKNITDRLPVYLLKEGDIVFGRKGAIDRSARISSKQNGWFLGSDCIRLRLPKNCDSRFIQYLFLTPCYKQWINQQATGTTMASLNQKIISRIPITIPPIKQQVAIADFLNSIDDKIELNNQTNQTLEAMAQAIFKHWFIDFEPFKDGGVVESELGLIPKGWEVTNLGSFGQFIKGKKPIELLSKHTDGTARYLTIDALNGDVAQYAVIDKMVLARDMDILMIMDGASSGLVRFGMDGIVGSTIAKLNVDNDNLREIIYQYLKINESEIQTHNTGSAIPHVDKKYVLNSKIVLPKDIQIHNIANSLSNIRRQIISNNNETQVLLSVRDTLLPKLMSGEIRVTAV